MSDQGQPTAALLLIGDELLSGRTQDKNFPVIAKFLAERGIDLNEVRVVSDVEDDIVAALNALRSRYTYVLTTGGIGPTHDDITADAVANAFGVKIIEHPDAVKSLHRLFADIGVTPNEARMRMARVPEGAQLLISDKIRAPGFCIDNVFVMAGVPHIMALMLEVVGDVVEGGDVMLSRSVRIEKGEGDLALPLSEIQDCYAEVAIGSYPFKDGETFGANIVLRCRDEEKLAAALAQVQKLV